LTHTFKVDCRHKISSLRPIRHPPQDDAKADVSVYNGAVKLFKTLRNIDSKYPLVADSLLTLVLAALAFFSLRAYWLWHLSRYTSPGSDTGLS